MHERHAAQKTRAVCGFLPAGLPEWLSPIPAIVAGQLFAYHLTVVKGYNPEQPRIIHKVTETE